MPNGDVPGGTGLVQVAVTLGSFIGGLFGGGGGDPPTAAQIVASVPLSHSEAVIQAAVEGRPAGGDPVLFQALLASGGISIPRIEAARTRQGRDPATGELLVTERFRQLPGPFVPEPDLPVLQELGIPFMDEPTQPQVFFPFQPREPDVLEEDMALDATLLAGFGGPLARQGAQAVAPTLGAIAGGLLENIFFRPVQETGLGQVPVARRAPTMAMPAEKPSTRILRMIQNNTGVRVKLSSAKALIRQLGLQNGARCLGISITDACTLIITASPRRRRGISGSDIRIVKRTARRFQSLQEDLSGLVSKRRAAPRRRRHVHAIQHTAPAP